MNLLLINQLILFMKTVCIKNLLARAPKNVVLALCMVFAGILFACKSGTEQEEEFTFPPCPDKIADVEAKMQEYLTMEYFMYVSEDRKNVYQVSPNKMVFQIFDSRIDSEEIMNILQEKLGTAPKVTNMRSYRNFIELDFENFSSEQVIDLVAHWTVLEKDTYAIPVMLDESGHEFIFVPDKFSVKIKNESDFPLMMRTLQSYHVESVELKKDLLPYDFVYDIIINCPHQRNAMQIANELHELGLFKWAAPGIIVFRNSRLSGVPSEPHYEKQWVLHSNIAGIKELY